MLLVQIPWSAFHGQMQLDSYANIYDLKAARGCLGKFYPTV